ncbi:Protein transport protein yos1 [Schizosaccharomyces pombe]|uniref:Protein transport protein yos1 n=1 Tax=Schizosaccharomyces pombe (strain 972 / ATCC 24843) TaxID=284812 RepID=YOS1_SCHPO|nr:putative ransport protein Yos1 [Schizosaccharomyces pombe]O13825.1 RecName: Full=Protein transport protein yos1 [Schizosaccharomyces pombe 972h-]CAB11645.1 ER to Golgi transport protein Yos1 (predicted) [Schizosaccharomyces pombe]|eukprot:NP_593783.1 putative ransport protein Yos1 [Schizosaccharomyces pombe]
MFGFGNILYVTLLLLNAVAILSEDRFLGRIGWSQSAALGFGDRQDTIKSRILHLIRAIRTVMTFPLIAINTIVIVYNLVLG